MSINYRNRIIAIQRFADSFWVKVLYKVPRGRKLYSCYVLDTDVRDNKVDLPWFHGTKK